MFDYFFIILIFLIGSIIAYQDIKFGLIKNKWILLGLVGGLIIYFISFFSGNLSVTQVGKIFLNSFISLIIGYLIWRFGLWSAGDAKLFALFAFLLPLKFYWKSYLPYFPSFVLLINIFLPIFIFYLIKYFVSFVKLLFDLKSFKKNFQEWLIEKEISLKFYFEETQDKKVPFAIWILVGVVITIILNGSIISFLATYLK